jgi:hypothetical protein
MALDATRRVIASDRFDAYQPETVAIENLVKVVQVMGDEEAAHAEAGRLNEVNREKECSYFVQETKLR